MELGIDIGEIDLIVMLNLPPSTKAFWQRFGRGGRQNPGVCLLIDTRGTLTDAKRGLDWHLDRPLEASWLYLENRYLQYANLLCAATEIVESGRKPEGAFASLPPAFQQMLENELNPAEVVPADLPRFQGGTKRLYASKCGFIVEAEMQVSERVLGFTERRGSTKTDYRYGPESPFYQKELARFFETTGVCWDCPERAATAEAVALLVREAFCLEFGVQERDLGVGTFFSRRSPLGPDRCQGACVFDSVDGSLRLSQRLAEIFPEVAASALALARGQGELEWLAALELLATFAAEVHPVAPEVPAGPLPQDQEWTTVVARGEKAVYYADGGTEEVRVLDYRDTPQGLMYELESAKPGVKWRVAASAVQPLYGETRIMQVNLMIGEEQAG